MHNSWHVATAAEAIAAAQFARCGWDVSVQYGANQPEYDLLVADKSDRTLKISVKGSKDGGWGLTQSYKANATYQEAADIWLARHATKTVMCFVQFKGVCLNELPRVYLALPAEVADWLKAAAGGRGDTILYERHVWTTRAQAAGITDEMPSKWCFTEERLLEIANTVG